MDGKCFADIPDFSHEEVQKPKHIYKHKPENFETMGMKEILMVSAFIEMDGKFLILKRSKKCKTNKLRWQLPEGKVRKNESLKQALKRELKEETNLKLIDAKFFDEFVSVIEFKGKKYKLIRKIFKCKVRDKINKIKLGEEHLIYKWVTLAEAKKLKWFKGFEKWIEDLHCKNSSRPTG